MLASNGCLNRSNAQVASTRAGAKTSAVAVIPRCRYLCIVSAVVVCSALWRAAVQECVSYISFTPSARDGRKYESSLSPNLRLVTSDASTGDSGGGVSSTAFVPPMGKALRWSLGNGTVMSASDVET